MRTTDPDPAPDPQPWNNLDHISENLETIFGVKILKFFVADKGSGTEKFGSGME
jgi:hypothetical protein